jgi:hypothetical protein
MRGETKWQQFISLSLDRSWGIQTGFIVTPAPPIMWTFTYLTNLQTQFDHLDVR